MKSDVLPQARRVGVLVDAENVGPACWPALEKAIAPFGTITVGRCFGDFSNGRNAGWLKVCQANGFGAVLALGEGNPKNGSDIALVIDALDLLWGGRLDVMCVVSSDSDFSPLGRRISASGLVSVGLGEAKAPDGLRASFQHYIALDVKAAEAKPEVSPVPDQASLVSLVERLCAQSPAGVLPLADLGKMLRQQHPEVSAQIGKGKLGHMLRLAGFDVAVTDGSATCSLKLSKQCASL